MNQYFFQHFIDNRLTDIFIIIASSRADAATQAIEKGNGKGVFKLFARRSLK